MTERYYKTKQGIFFTMSTRPDFVYDSSRHIVDGLRPSQLSSIASYATVDDKTLRLYGNDVRTVDIVFNDVVTEDEALDFLRTYIDKGIPSDSLNSYNWWEGTRSFEKEYGVWKYKHIMPNLD